MKPAEPVREIDTGLHIGKTNKRGITTRGVFDGGDQERELEKKYRVPREPGQWQPAQPVKPKVPASHQPWPIP